MNSGALRAPKILAAAELKPPNSPGVSSIAIFVLRTPKKNRHAPGAPLRTPRGTPAESGALKVSVT